MENKNKKEHKNFISLNNTSFNVSPFVAFSASTFAGTCGVIAGFPFDTIKVKLQTNNNKVFKSTNSLSLINRTWKQEGIRGLYRGLSVTLLVVPIQRGFSFSIYTYFYNLFSNSNNSNKNNNNNNNILNIKYHSFILPSAFAGAATGGLHSLFLTSFDRIRILRQSTEADSNYKTTGCVKLMLSNFKTKEGRNSLFYTTLLSSLRDIPQFSIYYGLYQYSQNSYFHSSILYSQPIPKLIQEILCNASIGMVCWTCCFPADVLRNVYIVDKQYRNKEIKVKEVIRNLYYNEGGLIRFYKGLFPTLIRSMISSATVLTTYTYLVKYLHTFKVLEPNE